MTNEKNPGINLRGKIQKRKSIIITRNTRTSKKNHQSILKKRLELEK